MQKLKIWKLSLGDGFFTDKTFKELKNKNLVSIHPNTSAKGQSHDKQGELFFKAKKGDLVYVCRSNNSVEFIGMFVDNRPLYSIIPGHEEWVDREIIILIDAINPKKYNRDLDKWWSPKNNSTFIQVDDLQLFEKEILLPAFGLTISGLGKKARQKNTKLFRGMEFYKELQTEFHELMINENYLFKKINELDYLELKKLEYELKDRSKLQDKPVVYLRSILIDMLLEGKKIDQKVVEDLKNKLSPNYVKEVYKSWKSSFRILYPFYYSQFRRDLDQYFKKLMNIVKDQLSIGGYTKPTLQAFDGAQNQGNDRLWFAFYNKTYKTQKYAYQLFFELHDGFKFGLNHMDKKLENDITTSDKFNLKELIQTFSAFLENIKNDNSMEKAEISNYADVLREKKQIILQGPPGTGKTRLAKQIARLITRGETTPEIDDIPDRVKLVQFHPSYTYEDFVRGIVSEIDNEGNLQYKVKNKVFADFALDAEKLEDDEDKNEFILIIDEINRANLPAVLGELIYGLEYRGDEVESMYALKSEDGKKESRKLRIPNNLYIIGTMNTADRSVSHLDYAIRRRFAFIPVLPDESVIKDPKAKELFKDVRKLFQNGSLANDFKIEDVQIGHSYFLTDKPEDIESRWEYEIMPILIEYRKDGILLENSKEKIKNLGDELLGK